jgi:hypothetical protein
MTNTIPAAEATSNNEKTLYVLMHVKKSSSQMAVRPKKIMLLELMQIWLILLSSFYYVMFDQL